VQELALRRRDVDGRQAFVSVAPQSLAAGAGRDQAADDDVFLQAFQRVGLACTAASVSTRVVSWNEAAEMNERVCSEALVMPSSTGWPVAGFLPSARSWRSLVELDRVDLLALQQVVSPASVISTFCSIWRTITSMCLSLIFTPCRR
jgi:hypothetical protein